MIHGNQPTSYSLLSSKLPPPPCAVHTGKDDEDPLQDRCSEQIVSMILNESLAVGGVAFEIPLAGTILNPNGTDRLQLY